MPRKNNPALTKEKILTVSSELFMSKGYENTSMQEIVNESGVSKGSIFHHFNSKEEILDTLVYARFEANKNILNKKLNDIKYLKLTAREKITHLLLHNIDIHMDANILKVMAKCPSITRKVMDITINKLTYFFYPIFQEGIEDGSITCHSPVECIQVFLLLYNEWCDPLIFECDLTTIYNRFSFLQDTMKRLGADIITNEVISANMQLFEKFQLSSDSC